MQSLPVTQPEQRTFPAIRKGTVVFDALTGFAAEIEEAIGTDATIRLLTRFGGKQIKVPAMAAGTRLAEAIGIEAANTLIDAFGHGNILVPCGHMRGMPGRRTRALRMLLDGASLGDVADAVDVHTRTVSNYRAALIAGGYLSPTPST
ncbi:helix-turn-helix domain-containing protein [Jannaschia rubra]|uniref:helix-turn-helix domain-containing protein n=1 Tax=Jannaschia rubra TaxID=282197 RepID=UPI002490917C|nr:helix-turn-helix domain-containing protein [Jannaschia rubra]